jgi:hypothetical protein
MNALVYNEPKGVSVKGANGGMWPAISVAQSRAGTARSSIGSQMSI